MNVRRRPLSRSEQQEMLNEGNKLQAVVPVYLVEAIQLDPDVFLDLLSKRLVGHTLLLEIDYSVIGTDPNEPNLLHIRVSGYVEDGELDAAHEDPALIQF